MKRIKNYLRKEKDAIATYLKKDAHLAATIFAVATSVSFCVYLLLSLILGWEYFTSGFFKSGEDLFMDTLNSIHDAARYAGVYTERGVIYPPMANLVFLALSRLISPEFFQIDKSLRYSFWYEIPSAMLCVLCFLLLVFSLFWFVFRRETRFNGKIGALFSFFIVFNLPVLYTLERGNIILLTALLSSIFFFNYHSESAVRREIGVISLALAFSLKLYPVVFGFVLLADKRYKEAVRCAVYGLLFLLLPSFFFGGPICLLRMVQNIFAFSENLGPFVRLPFGLPELALDIPCYVAVVVGAASFIVLAVKKATPWKIWAVGYATLFSFPSILCPYCWIFFLAPLAVFCREEKLKGKNIAYFVFFLLPCLFTHYSRWLILLGLFGIVTLGAIEAITLLRTKPSATVEENKQTPAFDGATLQ